MRPRIDNFSFKQLKEEEAGELIKCFFEDEIRKAVWECESEKSPGPDGVSFGLVKEFWEELKEDFIRFLLEFHVNGKLVKGINGTFIALIPKKDNQVNLNDFRPISLEGCSHKILSNVLANRLKRFLPSLISETQTTFIQGRQILDGIVIANEVINEAKRLKR
jgi:hypothetical protein